MCLCVYFVWTKGSFLFCWLFFALRPRDILLTQTLLAVHGMKKISFDFERRKDFWFSQRQPAVNPSAQNLVSILLLSSFYMTAGHFSLLGHRQVVHTAHQPQIHKRLSSGDCSCPLILRRLIWEPKRKKNKERFCHGKDVFPPTAQSLHY